MKQMLVHFRMDSERAVRDAFARYHVELGYPKILVSQESFPDYTLQDELGNTIRAEAEFRSSGYNHALDGCDLVICWEADKNLPIRILELARYVEVPHIFEGFQKNELEELSNCVKRYADIVYRSKCLLQELALMVKRKDLNSISPGLYVQGDLYDESIGTTYFLSFTRKGWQADPIPVSISLDLLKEEISLEGKLYTYLAQFKAVSSEKWRELFHEAKAKNFIGVLMPYSTDGARVNTEIDIDTFLQFLPTIDKMWCVAFTQRYDIDFLYQNRELILDSLSAAVISLLDLSDLSGIYGKSAS